VSDGVGNGVGKSSRLHTFGAGINLAGKEQEQASCEEKTPSVGDYRILTMF